MYDFTIRLTDQAGGNADVSFSLYIQNTLVTFHQTGPIPNNLFWITDIDDRFIGKQLATDATTKIRRPDGFEDSVFNVHVFRDPNVGISHPYFSSFFHVKNSITLHTTILDNSLGIAKMGFTDIPDYNDFHLYLYFEDTLTESSRLSTTIFPDYDNYYIYFKQQGLGYYKYIDDLIPDQLNLISLSDLNSDMTAQKAAIMNHHKIQFYNIYRYQGLYGSYNKIGLFSSYFDQTQDTDQVSFHLPNELPDGYFVTEVSVYHPTDNSKTYSLTQYGGDPLLDIRLPDLDLTIIKDDLANIVVQPTGNYGKVSGRYFFKEEKQEASGYTWHFQSTVPTFALPNFPEELGNEFDELNTKFVESKIDFYSISVDDDRGSEYSLSLPSIYQFFRDTHEKRLIHEVTIRRRR